MKSNSPPEYHENPQKKWLSKKDICALYGLTLRSLNRYLHEDPDPIPHFKLSHKVLRVDVTEFEAWALRRKVKHLSKIDRVVKEVLG